MVGAEKYSTELTGYLMLMDVPYQARENNEEQFEVWCAEQKNCIQIQKLFIRI